MTTTSRASAVSAATSTEHHRRGLIAEDLVVSVKGRHRGDQVSLISQVSIEVRPGEVLALIGPNGAGKSTLLNALSGRRTSSGQVMLDGRPLHTWLPRELARRRAVLPQSEAPGFPLGVLESVLLGRYPHGTHAHKTHRESAHDLAAVEASLNRVGALHLVNRSMDTLSGGERQRVRIARALAQVASSLDYQDTRPSSFLLLDEPCAGLDLSHARSLHNLIRQQAALGLGVVVVEHDLALAATADRVAVLHDGRLVALGPPSDTLSPQTLRQVFGLDGALIRTPAGGFALDLAPSFHTQVTPGSHLPLLSDLPPLSHLPLRSRNP